MIPNAWNLQHGESSGYTVRIYHGKQTVELVRDMRARRLHLVEKIAILPASNANRRRATFKTYSIAQQIQFHPSNKKIHPKNGSTHAPIRCM